MNNKECIKFGNYYLNSKDEKEPIEWLVLDKKDNKILLVSKYLLEFKSFNEGLKATTWETSSIREWLNTSFLETAFTSLEQVKIQTTRVKTEDDWYYNTNGGNATNDKIFLLSMEEVELYFNELDKKCCGTIYSNSLAEITSGTNANWWLRNMVSAQFKAGYVTVEGTFSSQTVTRQSIGIRCAMWVDLLATKDEYIIPKKEYIEFGKYYQSNNLDKENILWRILKREEDKVLVVSEKALDYQSMNKDGIALWNETTLKKWLNESFLQEAFTEEESKNIIGEIRLLNRFEALKYFEDRNDRKCYITDYAVSKGGYRSAEETTYYWLCTQGECNMMMINGDGSINRTGVAYRYANAIRPVVLIKIK